MTDTFILINPQNFNSTSINASMNVIGFHRQRLWLLGHAYLTFASKLELQDHIYQSKYGKNLKGFIFHKPVKNKMRIILII